MKLLVLDVGGRRLALPAQDVQRVLFYAPPQPALQAPPWLSGFLVLAQELVPVCELATLLGWTAPPPDLHSHLVLVASQDTRLLLSVTRVDQLVEVAPQDLRPLPPDSTLQGLMAAAWWTGQESVPLLVPRLLLLKEEKDRMVHWKRLMQKRLEEVAFP